MECPRSRAGPIFRLAVSDLFGALWALAGLGVSGAEGLPHWIVLALTLLVTGVLALTRFDWQSSPAVFRLLLVHKAVNAAVEWV